jgi:hypothetical protein
VTPRKRKRSGDLFRLVHQSTDIMALSPMVASARMLRLASQRPTVAAASLGNMAAEKMTAFGQAWAAIATTGMQAQFKFAMAMLAPTSLGSARDRSVRTGSDLADAMVSMVSSAMQPVHARVKRNAGKRKRG